MPAGEIWRLSRARLLEFDRGAANFVENRRGKRRVLDPVTLYKPQERRWLQVLQTPLRGALQARSKGVPVTDSFLRTGRPRPLAGPFGGGTRT